MSKKSRETTAGDPLDQFTDATLAMREVSAHEEALRLAPNITVNELIRIINAPQPADDIKREIDRLVATVREQFIHAWSPLIVRALGGGFDISGDDRGKLDDGRLSRRQPSLPQDFPPHSTIGPRLFIALFPDQMRQLLFDCVDAYQGEFGTPLADRAGVIETARAARKRAIAAHTAFVDRASALGINLELLPEVAQQRQFERLDRERKEAAAAERKRITDTVNAVNSGALRTGGSAYINSGGAVQP